MKKTSMRYKENCKFPTEIKQVTFGWATELQEDPWPAI